MSLTLLAPISEPEVESGPLTEEQKRLVRESFGRIEPAADLVARLFYLKSADLDPSIRELVKTPNRAQRRRFMAAMKVAVLSLDRLQALTPILRLLGVCHRKDGVTALHYDTFKQAWIWTLEQSLEARFSREAKKAWSVLLGEMANAAA